MIDVSCLPIRDERSVRAHTSRRNRGRDDQPKEVAMTDREVEAVSDFLRHFGSFGCRQICIRRAEPKPRTPLDLGHFGLETLATWRAQGLDSARLYKVATIAIHFDASNCPESSVCPRAAGRGARWNPRGRLVRAAP